MRKRLILLTAISLIALGAATAVLAQAPPLVRDTALAAGLPAYLAPSPVALVSRIVNIILGFVGVLAVVLIVLAGFKWMTSAGNEEQIREAKSLMRNAVIGLAIVLLAYIVTSFAVQSLSRAAGQSGSIQCVGIGQECGPNSENNAQCCAGLVCPNVGSGLSAICQYPSP